MKRLLTLAISLAVCISSVLPCNHAAAAEEDLSRPAATAAAAEADLNQPAAAEANRDWPAAAEAGTAALALAEEGDVQIDEANFPDANFRTWIGQNLDKDADGVLTDTEIDAVHQIDCVGAQIGDLTGIALFRNLEQLRCGNNSLTELDLSGNSQLVTVNCAINQLTALELGFAARLETLYCSNNQLKSLDVSNCPNLKALQCNANRQLQTLTLGELPDLYEFHCYSVSKSLRLDFSGCPKLGYAYANGKKTTESSVSTYITDASDEYGTAYLRLDADKFPVTGIKGALKSGAVLLEPVNFPDPRFLATARGFDTSGGADGRLSLSEREKVLTLRVDDAAISTASVEGIEYFPNLEQFYYGLSISRRPAYEDTLLASLDLSKNTKLTHIDISYAPKLTSLDVSELTELTGLNLNHTGVTSLDVSRNTKLAELRRWDYYYNTKLTNLVFGQNTALKKIDCAGNRLTSLDLSGLTALQEANFDSNELSSLNLSGCQALERLAVGSNQLSELDLDGITALRNLQCESNLLTSLDLSGCAQLEDLNCSRNRLAVLNLSDLAELRYVYCQENQLEQLDIAGCVSLQELDCCDNQLERLDVTEAPTMLRVVKEGDKSSVDGQYTRYSGTFDEQDYSLTCDDTTFIADGTPEPPAPVSIANAAVTLETTSYTYDGTAKKPAVTVILDGKTLVNETDYKIAYSSNINAGTAVVKVVGINDYEGTVKKTFKINPKKITPAVALSKIAYTWDGKAKKPSVTVKDGTAVLTKDTDYTVTYASGRKNVGLYKVTVKLKGNYSGSKSVTFKINPAGTAISSLTPAAKAITVKWTKQAAKMSAARITGYQIQMATDSKFTKSKKTITISGYSKVSRKIIDLKTGKKYYFRIRTYQKVDGKNYYSSWSKAKAAAAK